MKITFVLAVFLFMGCARQQVVLKENELVPAKDAADRTKVLTSQTISITGVEDLRQKPQFWVGTARTGATNKPTPVELERPVAAVVKSQMENELEQRGLKVTSPADVSLSVKVHQLEVSEVRSGLAPEASVCDTHLEVEVQPKKNAKPFKWKGKVSFQNRGTLLDTTKATAATLAGCLNLIVEKMVNNTEFKETLTR